MSGMTRAGWIVSVLLVAAAMAGAEPAAPKAEAGMVTLNFPENVQLKILVDYVGKRLGINFIYDEQILNKQITIKTSEQVPADSLMSLLQSVLRMKGLSLSPTEIDGTMRVETARALTAESIGPNASPDALQQSGPTTAVTTVFTLEHATPQRAVEVVTPFLSSNTASVAPLPVHNLIIVTDYLDNMDKIRDLVAVVDRPGRDIHIRFVQVKHLEASQLAQKVTQLLMGKAQARAGMEKGAASAGVSVVADERTNQVVVVGPAKPAADALDLIASLDVPLGTETRVYSFAVASPDHIDTLLKKLIGEFAAKRLYNSAADRDAGILIATTTPEIHAQIESLQRSLDKPIVETQSPIRFYKLQNAKAKDVLATLRDIEGDSGLRDVSVDGMTAMPRPMFGPDGAEPAEPILRGPTETEVNRGAAGTIVQDRQRDRAGAVLLRDARVLADEASNTIIVIAKPAMQLVYEKLIERLDVRRPQVLVEATVVAVDTSDNFALGVEISGGEEIEGGDGRVINFTSFGLSEVDPSTGELTLRPGIGFNSVLLSADIADIIIRALESDRRARVMARPSVLINDNATGVLLSESEEPFASVNASNTVATTSLGGFVSAGTKIEVTPQISEGDHLKLEYEITLSSFGEDVSEDLPPSRQKNSIASEATIPNGHTIVVGGLTRDNISEAIDRVPVLGSIPYVEYLFSNRTKDVQKTTLFVFIRAVILRDDKFEDLKSVSTEAARAAQLPGDHPDSEPVVIP